jgi:hypothetical protein
MHTIQDILVDNLKGMGYKILINKHNTIIGVIGNGNTRSFIKMNYNPITFEVEQDFLYSEKRFFPSESKSFFKKRTI